MDRIRKLLLVGVSLIALTGAPAIAADFNERFEGTKPAVSGVNGKIDFGYLRVNVPGGGVNGFYGIGSLSLPVGERFGVQIDAGLGTVGSNPNTTFGGIGAHGFWRDPDKALVGLYGHYVGASGGGSVWRIGVEAEAYLDRISLEGFAGADIARGGGSQTFFTGDLTAAFYATDNFRIHAGIGHAFERTYGKVGAEAILPFGANNVALYGDGAFSNNAQTYRAGLRVYFGESGKSLKARHREDDPRARLFDFFDGGANASSGDNGDNGGPPPCDEFCISDLL